MPSTATPKLSKAQIAAVMKTAGWPAKAIPVGVAVALAESGGNPHAQGHNRNGSTDYGLFQINSIHKAILSSGQWSDPVSNARMALKVYKDAGNSWRPWVTYNSGSYKKFYNANLSIGGETGDPLKDIGDGIKDVAGIANPVAGMGVIGSLGFIGSQAFWQRLGIGLLAAALIITGVIIVFRKPLAQGVKMASNLTPQGRAVGIATGGKL